MTIVTQLPPNYKVAQKDDLFTEIGNRVFLRTGVVFYRKRNDAYSKGVTTDLINTPLFFTDVEEGVIYISTDAQPH